MKKYSLLFALALACAASVAARAQNGARYHFDNFDVRDGVRVETPPAPTAPPSKRARRVKLTARTVETARAASSEVVVPSYEPAPAMSMAVAKSLDGFSTGDAGVDTMLVDSGTRHGVDPVLLYAIMHRESAFKKRAVSHAGARGLMQLMPGTAARFGVRDIFDPRQNIEGGTRYMRLLLDMFGGDVALALAGYNAGEGAVLKYGRRVPPYSETREYVRRITERYALMRDPQTARRALVATRAQVAAIKSSAKQTEPAPVYERNVFAVRMPDGKLQLVSQ